MSTRPADRGRVSRSSAKKARALALLRRIAGQVPAHLLLSVLALLAIVPFVFLVFSAFKPYIELTDPFPTFLPKRWSLFAINEIIMRRGFPMALWNTTLIAYALAQRTFVRGAQLSGLKG